MAYANPVLARAPGGLTTSRDNLELGGILTPDNSLRKLIRLGSHPDSVVEKIITHPGQSSTSPDGRPGGLPCPLNDWKGEFVRNGAQRLGSRGGEVGRKNTTKTTVSQFSGYEVDRHPVVFDDEERPFADPRRVSSKLSIENAQRPKRRAGAHVEIPDPIDGFLAVDGHLDDVSPEESVSNVSYTSTYAGITNQARSKLRLSAIPIQQTFRDDDCCAADTSVNERVRESIAHIEKFLKNTSTVEQPQTSIRVGNLKNRLPSFLRKSTPLSAHQTAVDTSPVKAELIQLRGQNEQLGHAIQVLVDRIEDLTNMVACDSFKSPVDRPSIENNVDMSPQQPSVVKLANTRKEAQLLAQISTLIEKDKKTKRRRNQTRHHVEPLSESSDTETDIASSNGNKQFMRPLKFDGISPFETFLAHFSNCAEHNQWNEADKLSWLKSSLIRNAGQVLWDSSIESTNTFTKLVDTLTNRFGGSKQTDKYRMELRYHRRKTNESLTDLHQDISRLMALAHPQLVSSSREVIACDYFIDSLNDPDFALKVRERNPISLDEALRVALQLEAWIRDTSRQKQEEASKPRAKEVRLSAIEKDATSQILSQMKVIESQLSDLCMGVSHTQQPVASNYTSDSSPMVRQPLLPGPSKPVRLCSQCGESTHIKPDCPTLISDSSGRTERQSKPVTTATRGSCFRCGDPSHYIKNCLQPPDPYYGKQTFRKTRSSETTNSRDINDCRVYIRARMESVPVDCLLDSGCEQTLIPLSLIKQCGYTVKKSDKIVRAANGTKLELAGEARVHLCINTKQTVVIALVSNDVEEVMLGYDFLVGNKCSWDFGRNRIQILGEWCKPFAKKGISKCRRLYVASDIIIPARQQVNLPVRATISSLNESDSIFMTNPKSIQKGLYLSSTMLPTSLHNIAVRVVNTHNEPRMIRKETYLGKLSSVCEFSEVSQSTESVESPNQPPASQTIIDSLPNCLSESQLQTATDLIRSFEDVFSQNEYDIGKTHLVEHTIDTGTHRPIRQTLRRHPLAHLETIDEQVEEMLAHGIVEPAASPWASNIVLAKKKDGSMRVCVDYRNINQITYQDTYPLPHIDTCLNALQGASWYSTLDLRSGYHNIPIRESDKDKTAFITRRGSFRYNVMPFGLTCAPSVFQRLMDLVLCGLTYEACMVYLDDIIVISNDFDTHIDRLKQVLGRIRQAGLKLKASKCCLFQEKVSFLGHVVSANGLEVQADKVESVKSWPVPSNLHDARSFVSFCSYYRRFIPGFANIAAPLYHLTKKGVRFVWGGEQQQAFDTLKSCLISAPVLAMPVDSGQYVLDTDASDTGLGAVLSQIQDGVERPIAYASRSLNSAERNYCTTRKELLAVVYGLKQYRQFLLGRPIVIRTDHSSLQWLRKTPEPVAQQARWLNFIEQFNYVIEHRAGAKHSNADALSRIPRPCKQCTHCSEEGNSAIHVAVRSSMMSIVSKETQNSNIGPSISGLSFEEIAKLQQDDHELGCIVKLRLQSDEQPSIEALQSASETTKVLWSQWYRLVVKDGVVYKLWFSKGGEPSRLLLLAPKTLREDIIKNAHGGMSGGHMGIAKTCQQVQRRAFWLGWRRDVVHFCRRCDRCCRYHRGQLPRRGPLQPILAGAPFERLSIDLTGPHCRTPRGSVYILTCIDVFSKWTEAFAIPNKEAKVVARVLVEQVFCRFGTPISLLSDNGTEVDSSIMREICQLLGIDKIHTTAYKASTNAAIERFHRTLNSMLGKVISERQDDWDLMLPYVMAAYRSSIHESTGYTPNQLMLARENRAPVDIIYGTGDVYDEPISLDSYVDDMRDRMRTAHDIVRSHLCQAALRNKNYYDMRVRPAKYKKGDWVYYYNPRKFKGRQDKWSRKYTGPFCVVSIPGPVNVELQRSSRSRSFIVHIDKVKMYHGDPPICWLKTDHNESASVVASDEHDDNDGSVIKVPTDNIEIPDVVNFDTDQEFRRSRPRRAILKPARFRS